MSESVNSKTWHKHQTMLDDFRLDLRNGKPAESYAMAIEYIEAYANQKTQAVLNGLLEKKKIVDIDVRGPHEGYGIYAVPTEAIQKAKEEVQS